MVANVCERIINEKLLDFSLVKDIIPDTQHGFLPGRSVITYLLSCVSDWSTMLDFGAPVNVLYLDFSRAFERVSHRRLLLKLDCVRGDLLLWIGAFLSGRVFRLRVGGALSSSRNVRSGIPQVSVLGPLLFLMYTSDLPSMVRCAVSSFADDTKIYGNPLTDSHALQYGLKAIQEWFDTWKLPLNLDKCKVPICEKKNHNNSYF